MANVWRPAVVAGSGMPQAGPVTLPASDEEDAALESAAWQVAEDGARRAAVAGLRARCS